MAIIVHDNIIMPCCIVTSYHCIRYSIACTDYLENHDSRQWKIYKDESSSSPRGRLSICGFLIKHICNHFTTTCSDIIENRVLAQLSRCSK
jgi:hypothetical protein